MKHPDDDTLLKYTLETLEDDKAVQVKEHLRECIVCQEKIDRLNEEMRVIGGYESPLEPREYPLRLRRKGSFTGLFKAAAILTLGFISGYLVSEVSRGRLPVNVVPQILVTKSAESLTDGFFKCEQVDIDFELRYKQISK